MLYFSFRARLVCFVSKGQEPKRPGPFASSRHDEIQYEFREGGCNEVSRNKQFLSNEKKTFALKFLRLVQEELIKKRWLLQPVRPSPTMNPSTVC